MNDVIMLAYLTLWGYSAWFILWWYYTVLNTDLRPYGSEDSIILLEGGGYEIHSRRK